MNRSESRISQKLAAAGARARARDVSATTVARVRDVAGQELAAIRSPPAAAWEVAWWGWRAWVGYGVAALLVWGIFAWPVSKTDRAVRLVAAVAPGKPHLEGEPVASRTLPSDATLVARTVAIEEAIRAWTQRYRGDPLAPPQSRAEALAATLAVESGKLRAELAEEQIDGGG